MRALLAVDVGVRTGLAFFGDDACLRWYRSHNLGSVARLRRAVPALLAEYGVSDVVAEGGGPVADVWKRECERSGVHYLRVSAEQWRADLLLPREQRNGVDAKRTAGVLARRVIEWSGAPRATSLRHDAAEAILVGVWGMVQLGWLRELPRELRG
jgi:hypothetical protein